MLERQDDAARTYRVVYGELFAPIVKSIQEQQQQIATVGQQQQQQQIVAVRQEQQQQQIAALHQQNADLPGRDRRVAPLDRRHPGTAGQRRPLTAFTAGRARYSVKRIATGATRALVLMGRRRLRPMPPEGRVRSRPRPADDKPAAAGNGQGEQRWIVH